MKLTSVSTEWSQRSVVSGSFTRLVFWEEGRNICSTVVAHMEDIGASFTSERIKLRFYERLCWTLRSLSAEVP